jgi:hypothetical protein
VELSYREGERFLAPFVEVNAEALPVGARSTTFANVSTPNIRIKRAMEAYNVFLRRQPATNVFINNSAPVMAARTQAIAEDLLFMSDMIDNRLEWMAGQLISGVTDGKMVLSYEVQTNANWRIEIPRATDVDITLATTNRWAEPVVSSTADLMNDFLTVKRILAKHVDSPPTVCVMDSIAANGLLRLIKSDAGWRDLFRGDSNISTGDLNLKGAVRSGRRDLSRHLHGRAALGIRPPIRGRDRCGSLLPQRRDLRGRPCDLPGAGRPQRQHRVLRCDPGPRGLRVRHGLHQAVRQELEDGRPVELHPAGPDPSTAVHPSAECGRRHGRRLIP